MAAKRHTQGAHETPQTEGATCPFVHQGNYYCPVVPAELDVSINEVIRANQS